MGWYDSSWADVMAELVTETAVPIPTTLETLMQACELVTETAVLASALKDESFTIVATCPGWVATDMGSGSNEVCTWVRLLSLSPPGETGPSACLSYTSPVSSVKYCLMCACSNVMCPECRINWWLCNRNFAMLLHVWVFMESL